MKKPIIASSLIIGETTNLIAIEKRTGRQLARNLHQWRKSMNAQMPAINPDYQGN